MGKYEEALGRAKAGKPIDEVFPELKDSEDERIRKFLIDILSHGTWRKEWPFGPNEVVAYLEKQKEQKPVECEWPNLSNCIKNCKWCHGKCFYRKEPYEEQKPAEWSEEDEKMFDRLKEILNIADAELCKKLNGEAILIGEAEFNYLRFGIAHCLSWLELRIKSLRPQPHWKPSEEQMKALEYYMVTLICTKNKEVLFGLYNDLKSL